MAMQPPQPQENSAQDSDAGQAPGQAQGGSVADLISNISKGLAMLVDASAQAAPEISQALQKINDEYKSVVEQMMGQEGAKGPGGPAAPEAAGAQGAVPAGAPPKGAIPMGGR